MLSVVMLTAKCRVWLIVTLNVVKLSVVMLSVVMLSVVMLSVILLIVVMLKVVFDLLLSWMSLFWVSLCRMLWRRREPNYRPWGRRFEFSLSRKLWQCLFSLVLLFLYYIKIFAFAQFSAILDKDNNIFWTLSLYILNKPYLLVQWQLGQPERCSTLG